MSNNQQADNEIHKDQLLSFPVNSFDEEVALLLAENAKLGAEDIYGILAGACIDGVSVLTLCEGSEDTPHESSVLYYLRIKFDLETPEQAGNMPLQRDVLDVLPQQMEVCADLHLRSYYGDGDDTDGPYHSQAKRGTTTFHTYATPYACMKDRHYTLVVRRLEDSGTASSVLAELLGILDDLNLGVKAVYLDRELYDSKCSILFQTYNHAYVMPIVHWGWTIKRELSEGCNRVIQHSLIAKLSGHSWTVEFPVYIDRTYQDGRYDEYGVAHHGYAVDASFIDSSRDARYHYTKHFGIEASYQLSEQNIATVSTQNPIARLLYVVVSLLL